MVLSRIHSIADFRAAARRALPRMVFDFVDGGAGTESTLEENRAALERVRLVPSAPVDVAVRTQAVPLFGAPSAMPVIIGPTGLAGALWPEGDLALARAAARHCIPFVMSSNGGVTVERLGAATTGRRWFQIYLYRERERTARLLGRVRDAGFEVLQVTVDTAVLGRRLRDARNGFSPDLVWTPARVADVLRRPAWLYRILRHGKPRMILIEEDRAGTPAGETLAQVGARHLNPSLTWDEIAWVRDTWRGPLVVKGLSDPRQAERAAAVGCDGVVVSNHGGRQLDGAVASLDALPDVVAASGGRLTVLVDGGFRTGSDIVKALALGAAAVQVGRATLYALATAGEAGVDHALALLRDEIDTAQALCGLPDINAIGREAVRAAGARP